jgi:uncharacterized membrane protein YdbT with pleckstrin-like domain
VKPHLDEAAILALERPHANLWTYYVLNALMIFPLAPVLLPYFWFRYRTMRYRFDDEGVSMSWGILWRRQVVLNYARIQDIHLQSNIIERWLGLSRVMIQTASGSSSAEMTIEGLQEFEAVRDFLYSKMRGIKEGKAHPATNPATTEVSAANPELAVALRAVATELREIRQLLATSSRQPKEDRHV